MHGISALHRRLYYLNRLINSCSLTECLNGWKNRSISGIVNFGTNFRARTSCSTHKPSGLHGARGLSLFHNQKPNRKESPFTLQRELFYWISENTTVSLNILNHTKENYAHTNMTKHIGIRPLTREEFSSQRMPRPHNNSERTRGCRAILKSLRRTKRGKIQQKAKRWICDFFR